MFEVRIHGRGGQQVATTAELLAVAASVQRRFGHAGWGAGPVEPAGAPVSAYCRLSDLPIRFREPVLNPDALIMQDPTVRHRAEVSTALVTARYVLINSAQGWEDLGLDRYGDQVTPQRTRLVPATDLALTYTGRPFAGAVLLGGFAALTGQVSLEALVVAIYRRFPLRLAEGTVRSARAGYAYVQDPARQPVPPPAVAPLQEPAVAGPPALAAAPAAGAR